jgi:hypothetical protein
MMEDKKGEPLGVPEKRGRGDAEPAGAGAEGGLGSFGDQRQPDPELNRPDRKDEHGRPPLDGTMTKEDVEGDDSGKKPGATMGRNSMWNGPRLSMEARKRQPLIIW